MDYVFFLGGKDLEMETIKSRLIEYHIPFVDKNLEWGAAASAYLDEINAFIKDGKIPVLVELKEDVQINDHFLIIDHHGDASGNPASIIQVLNVIDVKPTRYDKLVAANDSGYIPGMQKIGATQDEINEIRLADRKAQGVTEEMEQAAEMALQKCSTFGDLVVVQLGHTKCSPVTDRLFPTWPEGKENLLVICEDLSYGSPLYEINYFGRGDICSTIKESYSGWGGGTGYGKVDGQGFAGCKCTKEVAYSIMKKVSDFYIN